MGMHNYLYGGMRKEANKFAGLQRLGNWLLTWPTMGTVSRLRRAGSNYNKSVYDNAVKQVGKMWNPQREANALGTIVKAEKTLDTARRAGINTAGLEASIKRMRDSATNLRMLENQNRKVLGDQVNAAHRIRRADAIERNTKQTMKKVYGAAAGSAAAGAAGAAIYNNLTDK